LQYYFCCHSIITEYIHSFYYIYIWIKRKFKI